MSGSSICLLPNLEGVGGPASFYARFKAEVQSRGINVHSDPDDPGCSVAMIIGGTRHLNILRRLQKRGVRLVQRLDGMNWIHKKRRTGVRHYLRSEVNNMILQIIRRDFAEEVIYQSRYVEDMWHREFGPVRARPHLIYNGVDLEQFTPEGVHHRPSDHIRMLVVEGRLRGGHEIGLENAVFLAEELGKLTTQRIELMILAEVDEREKKRWDDYEHVWINWGGVVAREKIPELDRSAHVYFSAEVNAPCPNSVIEAMACGLPIVSFSTGSLPELVQGDAGILVPYGQAYEKLGRPNIELLASAAAQVISDQTRYRVGARNNAVEHFDIKNVVDRYLEVLLS